MSDTQEDILDKRISELEKELDTLRLQQNARRDESDQKKGSSCGLPLELEEYVRYGRQMIIPQIGLPGQLALKKSSVLVIGAGGLGCPVLLYLVAAGIGIHCLYFDCSNLQERWV
jgi:adenylyltransferase and sulfurtransferase